MASEPIRATYDETLEAKLDQYVDVFEEACDRDSNADVADFLPPESDASFQLIGLELLRVDLQRQWRYAPGKVSLTNYRQRFPHILRNPAAFGELAFEEYRTRIALGEKAAPSQYHEDYGVDVAGWPRISDSTLRMQTRSTSTVVEQLAKAADGELNGADSRAALERLSAGDTFVDFELKKKIGRGTFAQVFVAEQPQLSNRRTVLKISANDAREAQQLARLQHTHIVPIHSVHHTEQLTAVCMPFFGPCTLRDLTDAIEKDKTQDTPETSVSVTRETNGASRHKLPTQGDYIQTVVQQKHERLGTTPSTDWLDRLPWSERSYVDSCVLIGKQIAAGLHHAHAQGIVHGDLKPGNVLLADHGPAMLLDFNLSDRTRTIPNDENTPTGGAVIRDAHPAGEPRSVVGGTLSYAAPEHLRSLLSGSHIGPATDLYSLGMVLHHLLTGELPYPARPGSSEHAIREMIADRDVPPPSLRRANPQVSPSIDAVVRKLLSPAPHDRYETAAQLVEDLSQHLEHRPLRHVRNASYRERIQKWNRRHPRLTTTAIAGLFTLFVSLVFAGALLANQRRAEKRETLAAVRTLQGTLPEIRAFTSIPGADAGLLKRGLDLATATLQPPNDRVDLSKPSVFLRLNRKQQNEATIALSECYFLQATAHIQLARKADNNTERERQLALAQECNRMATAMKADRHAAALQNQQTLITAMREGRSDIVVAGGGSATDDSFLRAVEEIQNYQYPSAISRLETLREQQPFDLSLWLLLGNCYSQTHKLEAAENCFTTCALMWQGSPLGFFQRGLCRLDQQDYDGAVEDFTRVLEIDDEILAANINRAVALGKLGRDKAALKDLDRAIEAGAPQTRIYFLRGEIRKRIGDTRGASQDFQTGLTLEPRDDQSYVRRGLAVLKTDPAAALQDFKAALQINPNSYAALRNWAFVVAEKQGRTAEAIPILDRILRSRPDLHSEIVSRGVLHARLAEYKAAVNDGERALLLSDDAKTEYQVACIYALCGQTESQDYARAIRLLDQAFSKDSKWRRVAKRDPDLNALRSYAPFRELMKQQ